MRKRCDWPGENKLMIEYHDTEWGVPVHDDRKLFEFLLLDNAQAGLSWQTILNKRENYRKAFDNFDPAKIARYNKRKITSLLNNPGIVRNRLKVQSAVTNARIFLEIQAEFGSFDTYIWQFVTYYTNQPVARQEYFKKNSVRCSLLRVDRIPWPVTRMKDCLFSLFLPIFVLKLGHSTLPVRYWISKELDAGFHGV